LVPANDRYQQDRSGIEETARERSLAMGSLQGFICTDA
jgi:hypothetical protein